MGRLQRPGLWPVEQREDLVAPGLDSRFHRLRGFVFFTVLIVWIMTLAGLELLPLAAALEAQGVLWPHFLIRLPVAIFLAFLAQYALSHFGIAGWERHALLSPSGQRASWGATALRAALATACICFPPLLLYRPEGRWLWDAVSKTRLVHPLRISDADIDRMAAALDEEI